MLEKVEQYPEKYNEFVLYMHRKGVCVGGLVLLYMHAGVSMELVLLYTHTQRLITFHSPQPTCTRTWLGFLVAISTAQSKLIV